jgi:hypothetical protein
MPVILLDGNRRIYQKIGISVRALLLLKIDQLNAMEKGATGCANHTVVPEHAATCLEVLHHKS